MRRLIVAFAAAVLLAGGVAAAGTAGARPGIAPLDRWCPGDPLPAVGLNDPAPVGWDMAVCHNFYYAASDGRLIEGLPPPLWIRCGTIMCPVYPPP